jgi:hypothetical protein
MHVALPARLAHDRQFALAVAAGPVAWLAGALALGMQPAPAWVLLGDPVRFASVALAWPLIEEWLFRGIIQPRLLRTAWGARKAWGVTTANTATSVLFVLAHLVSRPPEWAVAVFVPSLAYGHFRDRYASIAPGAALHVVHNTGWFLFVSP